MYARIHIHTHISICIYMSSLEGNSDLIEDGAGATASECAGMGNETMSMGLQPQVGIA